MTKSPVKKMVRYGYFFIAAAMYMLGIVIFSTWSFFEQRALLMTHIDESLINTTFAIEQIIATPVSGMLTNSPLNTLTATRMQNLAMAGNFDAIGSLERQGTNVHSVVAGIRTSENTFNFNTTALPEVSNTVLELAQSQKNPIQVKNIRHPQAGVLRVAIRYRAIDANRGTAWVVARNITDLAPLMQTQLIRSISSGFFLLIMVVPLIALYNRTQTKTSKQLNALNTKLQQEIETQKMKELDLRDAIHDLERFTALSVGREERVIELKVEVNALLKQAKQPPRYTVDPEK